MSFAGCISQIFYLMSKKMHVSVSALKVNAKAEKPDDAKTVTKADIEIEVTTNESEDKINEFGNIPGTIVQSVNYLKEQVSL
jgi:uncharacterized OsmC-like protein